MPYNKNDIDEMLLVQEHLEDELRFALQRKDWHKLSGLKRKLKSCKEQIASLQHRNRHQLVDVGNFR